MGNSASHFFSATHLHSQASTTTLLREMGEKQMFVLGNILHLIQALVLQTEEPGYPHQAPR